MAPNIPFLALYEDLKKEAKTACYSVQASKLLGDTYSETLSFLKSMTRQDLVSRVEGKEYFAFSDGKKMSRAINDRLYNPQYDKWQSFSAAMTHGDISTIARDDIEQILYTMAISFCACVDLIKEGDQKTPGTFFEYFIAHFFTWRVGVEPTNSIKVLKFDEVESNLPTDFIFNLGPEKQKFHMPIKTSTRERSIMLWAHQKLLDGVYGIETFMGTPVLLAETKTDKKKKEVIEICLPEQWMIYQRFIARLKRIYYLDLPLPYANLSKKFPPFHVKSFADFLFEWSELSPS